MNIATVGRVPDPVKTRRYDSPLRVEQAERTRHAVLTAARALFTSRGYADTSVADVARLAGVSVDTVYASAGRKPQLLLAVHDMVLASSDEPLPAEERDYVRRIRAATTAEEKIRAYAAALADRLPHVAPLAEALRQAAASDEACRTAHDALTRRRAANMRRFAADLRSTGQLREDLTDDTVADLVWSMNAPEYFRLLVERGRSPEQYAVLVADVWIRTLLR